MRPDDKQSDRELWNDAIHWLLHFAPTELGMRGTLAGTISSLEHGGAGGVPNSDPYSDYQMGWCAGDSPAEKWRRWSPVWFMIDRGDQAVLLAHYAPRNDLPPAQRTRLDGALGLLSAAALHILKPESVTRLISACLDQEREGRAKIIDDAIRKTEARVRAAHRAWYAAAAERARWHVGAWEGSPVRRRVTCPVCSSSTMQLLADWARAPDGRSLPRKCDMCDTKLKEPREVSLAGAPAPRRPPRAPDVPTVDRTAAARWDAEYDRARRDREREQELRAAVAVAKACRAFDPRLLAARVVAAACRRVCEHPHIPAVRAVASACRRICRQPKEAQRRAA